MPPDFIIKYDHIDNIDALSYNLGVEKDYLEQVIQLAVIHYHIVKIPKRGKKGVRELYIANPLLRSLQKIIRDDLSTRHS